MGCVINFVVWLATSHDTQINAIKIKQMKVKFEIPQMKVEYLAPYLPYKLKINTAEEELISLDAHYKLAESEIRNNRINIYELSEVKPMLRQISDLFNGNYYYILDEFSGLELEAFKSAFLAELRSINYLDKLPYSIAQMLFKEHFDLFGLIDKGLAKDINEFKEL